MSDKCRLLVLITVGVAFGSCGAACQGETPEFNPRVVINRAFPAITEPPTVMARNSHFN